MCNGFHQKAKMQLICAMRSLCTYLRGDQDGSDRRRGDVVPCADNYRSAKWGTAEKRGSSKARCTPTPRCIGFTTHHLSLKDRNGLKPRLLTQVGKSQPALSVEVSKYSITVSSVLWNSHGALVLLFCRLRTCSVHRVGYWEIISERIHRDSFIMFSRKDRRISANSNLVVP